MPLSDVTASYVDLITNSQYTARTSDWGEFEDVKGMVSVYMSESAWPAQKYKHGIALLMAHYYAQTGNTSGQSVISDANGPVASESVGDVSRSYTTQSTSSGTVLDTSWLSSTRYGREWLMLMRSFRPQPSVTGQVQVSVTTARRSSY